MGRPLPSKILPSISLDTGSLTVSPVNRTRVFPTSRPVVPSNTCTTATPPPISRTWPLLSSPLGVLIRASSPYPTPRTDSTKRSGPEISLIVVYSKPASDIDYFPPIDLNSLFSSSSICSAKLGKLSASVNLSLYWKIQNLLEWNVLVNSFLHDLVIVENQLDHQVSLDLVTIGVGWIVCGLHEKVLLDHPSSL